MATFAVSALYLLLSAKKLNLLIPPLYPRRPLRSGLSSLELLHSPQADDHSWDENKTRHLLRLISLDPLCAYHSLFAYAGSNKRLNDEARAEHASTLLELSLRLFESHFPFWKADMERRGLIETDEKGVCRPSATWILTKHTYNNPVYTHLKHLKNTQAKFAKEIKEQWTTWEEVRAADSTMHDRIRVKHPFFFSIRRLLQKVNSLEQSRSETPSSRTAGSTTPAESETDPSLKGLKSISRIKKRTSDVIAPTLDEKSKPVVPAKKPRQLPNFTKIARPPRSPETSERDCKPLIPSTTASPLTPLPRLPDESVGPRDYLPTPTLSIDEIGSNSSHSAASIPLTPVATPTAMEQYNIITKPRYSPSRDPRIVRRTVDDRNTLGITLGPPDTAPLNVPLPVSQTSQSPIHAKQTTPVESALITPISAQPDRRLNSLPVNSPVPVQNITPIQDITPINIEPVQIVPFIPKYEPSRDPRLQRRLNAATAQPTTVKVDQFTGQRDEQAGDKSTVRIEESTSRGSASVSTVSGAKPKSPSQTTMSTMPERSQNLASGNAFKVKPIAWEADPIYTQTLLSILYSDPRIRSALLPDLHPHNGREEREPWKVERDTYIRVIEKEPGQKWLKEAKSWRWVGVKEKAGGGVGWKASMLWPRTEGLGLKDRLVKLRIAWREGKINNQIGMNDTSTNGPPLSAMLELLFGAPVTGLASIGTVRTASVPQTCTAVVPTYEAPDTTPESPKLASAENYVRGQEEDFNVTPIQPHPIPIDSHTHFHPGGSAWSTTSPSKSSVAEEGQIIEGNLNIEHSPGGSSLPKRPNNTPTQPRSKRTSTRTYDSYRPTTLATGAKDESEIALNDGTPRAMIRLAKSLTYCAKDLPKGRWDEYKCARSDLERAEILELGKAELFIEGLMGIITAGAASRDTKRTEDRCFFNDESILSPFIVDRLQALLDMTGGHRVDSVRDLAAFYPFNKFEIQLFAGGPRDRFPEQGRRGVLKNGLMEYLRRLERAYV